MLYCYLIACPPNCAACTAEAGKMRCDACVTNYVLMDDKSCESKCPTFCSDLVQDSITLPVMCAM